jgi:phage terminase Nu1 subunit (DNA packaging protein)
LREAELEVTRQQLAALLGVAPNSIARLVQSGMPGPIEAGGGRGRPAVFDAAQCVAWQRERALAELEDTTGDPQARSIRDEYLAALRDKVQLELAARRGELVAVANVQREAATIGTTVKAKLRSIPAAVAVEACAAAAKGPAVLQAMLLARIDEALLELSRLARVPSGAEPPEAASLGAKPARTV